MQQNMWLEVMVVEVSAMLRAAKHVVGDYGGWGIGNAACSRTCGWRLWWLRYRQCTCSKTCG